MAMTQPNRTLQPIEANSIVEDSIFTPRKIELIKNRYFVEGASDDELQLFLTVAAHRGLDPTKRHIFAVERYNSQKRRSEIAYQVSIDGLRLIAERTRRYEGQTPTYWCGKDGAWREVWLDTEPPAAAKIGVYRQGFREPVWAVARYSSYVQTTRDNKPNRSWQNMPDIMLAKCAESLALRKAFPEEAGGLYTEDEMGQADSAVINIDTDTGEIHDAPQDRPAPRTAPERTPQASVEVDSISVAPEAFQRPAPRPPGRISEKRAQEAAQAELVDPKDDREKANKYAHVVADGLFGKSGHDVLHVMADVAWGKKSLTDCSADDLRELGRKLEGMSPEQLDKWYEQWIRPRMPQEEEA